MTASSAQDQTGSVTVALSPTLDTASTLISTIQLGAFPGIGLPLGCQPRLASGQSGP